LHEGIIVLVAVKDLGALVAPVQDVVTVAADGGAGSARHPSIVQRAEARRKGRPHGSTRAARLTAERIVKEQCQSTTNFRTGRRPSPTLAGGRNIRRCPGLPQIARTTQNCALALPLFRP
jgi:hypothetical protein